MRSSPISIGCELPRAGRSARAATRRSTARIRAMTSALEKGFTT